MIMSRAELEATPMPQIRQLVNSLNLPQSPTDTKEILITRLLNESAKQPEKPEEPTEPKDIDQVECTMEQVKTAVNGFILRGMKVFYNKDEKTWLFRIQLKSQRIRDTNSGEIRVVESYRDDSGTLKQPLAAIKRCASVLMQGAPSPREVEAPRDPAKGFEKVA